MPPRLSGRHLAAVCRAPARHHLTQRVSTHTAGAMRCRGVEHDGRRRELDPRCANEERGEIQVVNVMGTRLKRL